MYEEMDAEHSRLNSWVFNLGYLTYTEDLCKDLEAFGRELATIFITYGLECRPRNSQILELRQHGIRATIYYALGSEGYMYSIAKSYYVEPLRLHNIDSLIVQVMITFQCGGCYYSSGKYCGRGLVMDTGTCLEGQPINN